MKKRNNVFLYANGSARNRGCEAISVSSRKILDGLFDTYYLSTNDLAAEGLIKKLDRTVAVDYTNYKYMRNAFLLRCVNVFTDRFLKGRYYLVNSSPFLHRRIFSRCRIAVSAGGDNYCYGNNEWLIFFHSLARRCGCKTVLWGCSVDACDLDEKTVEDLKNFDLICARESITYENLRAINKNTVLVADPAFTLEKELRPLTNGFCKGNTVGINISPVVVNNSENGKSVLAAYEKLIEYIISETDMQIALINHVYLRNGRGDDAVSALLYKKFADSGRVFINPEGDCRQLKGDISRCRFFVGARTHATIAAYSTLVPTLVTGYSVKSLGIARDIFGENENFVVDIRTLGNPDELCEAFRKLMQNEKWVRAHLAAVMPDYIARAKVARDCIEKLG